jgi:hypothetical protein
MFERCAREFELPCRLEADGAVGTGKGDDVAAFLDRLPSEFGERHQEVADASRLVIARGAVIVAAIDELLMLGADQPALFRLLALDEGCEQIVEALDRRVRLRSGWSSAPL